MNPVTVMKKNGCWDEKALGDAAACLKKAGLERMARALEEIAEQSLKVQHVTLDDIMKANVTRCDNRFHRVEGMNPLEWAGCMAGEAGEAANAAKKLWRLNNSREAEKAKKQDLLKEQVMCEIADTLHYATLFAFRVGWKGLEQAVIDTFNKKSLDEGFPERMGTQGQLWLAGQG